MKKTFILLFVLSFMLTACGNLNTSSWHYEKNLTEEQEASLHDIIDEQLALLEESPDDSKILFEIALRYQQLGEYGEAIEYYEKVLEQNDTDWPTLNNLASLYEDMEEYEKAAEYIKRLYELDSTSIEVTKDTVRILLEANDVSSAEQALENFEKQMLSAETHDPLLQTLADELRADIEEWKLENSSSIN